MDIKVLMDRYENSVSSVNRINNLIKKLLIKTAGHEKIIDNIKDLRRSQQQDMVDNYISSIYSNKLHSYDESYRLKCNIMQLADNLIKLKDAESKALNYKNLLDVEQGKLEKPIVKVFMDFVASWKEKVFNYLVEKFHEFKAEYIEFREKVNELEGDRSSWVGLTREQYSDRRREVNYKTRELRMSFYEHRWYSILNREWVSLFESYRIEKVDDMKQELNKILEKEKNRKYFDLIERVSKYTGEFTDVSSLQIGITGEIDGVVMGENGTAKVQTIGAGGYNIQIFHYRVLVNKLS